MAPLARAEGPMVLVGGSLKNPRIYEEIIRLGGGRGAPRVAIVTAASADERENGRYYRERFARFGARQARWVDLASRDAPRLLRGADVIFFGGGDQSRLLDRLEARRALIPAIRDAHRRGAVIAGTSAGTAAQSSPMITGDAPSFRPRGLGLFPDGILDTHFRQRDREDRLIALARMTGVRHAFGIDENTALVVDGRELRVIGQHRVTHYTVDGGVSARALRPGTRTARLR